MFSILKNQVRANFDKMAAEQRLFYVDIDRDEIWTQYLNGFSDPVVKQSYNCNCCKTFFRQYAGIVAIIDNKRVSIWDNITDTGELTDSIENVRKYIAERPITDLFLNGWANCGTDRNTVPGTTTEWTHFYFRAPSQFVKKEDKIASLKGDYNQGRSLFKRGLDTITLDTLDTVLELIAQNSLYKGSEFKGVVEGFKALKIGYLEMQSEEEREHYAWTGYGNNPPSFTLIRNSAIGTLLVDLSEEREINEAVGAYEFKVAPTNYKRTSSLATPTQIKNAKDKLESLGCLGSLERRYAESTDLSLNDILYIDKSSELSDPFDELTKVAKGAVIHPKEFQRVDEITIEKFVSDVLPLAKSVELYLQPEHFPKMVSLLTAQDSSTPSLFKWSNPFSWSYTGGITDSIKERVKAAGGQIVGELRISLSWSNYDDLDLHVTTPRGKLIYYRDKVDNYTLGNLDVDMNAGSGQTRTPVENIIFPSKEKMTEGTYLVQVNQYTKRESSNGGYTVQIEYNGQITDIVVDKSPTSTDNVIRITYSKENGITFDRDLDSKVAVKEKWGLSTHRFIKVKQMFLSPNFWNENAVGNKHYMFMLEGCISDEAPKPFFNEFLGNQFLEDRKTFEMLADKYPVAPSDTQLSGLGFSDTLPGEVVLRVEGSFKRLLKIKF